MEDLRLVVDLVLALGAAFVGGMVAQRLGQPVLLGYILAGVLIGPNTPGLVADRERVELLANLGVALLMFALGVEFSFNELRRVRRVALLAGGIQIPLTVALGMAVGWAIGWPLPAALLLGGAFAISSSIVALKLLLGRGEGDSPQARVALGLGIVQDLSLVPMLALVPLLAGDAENVGLAVARSLGTAALALVVVSVVGTRLVPKVFYAVARTGSRELFLLSVVLIALGTALASHEAGLSFALGAFLAGLVVSESEFDSQVLAEVIPLRDIFATLFFVAVGMLLEPRFVLDNVGIVLAAIAALVIGKLLITGGAFLAAGVDHRTAALGALLLAQMGEFSFVLAGVGLADGVIDGEQYGLVLAVAVGSILLAPLLLAAAPRLVDLAERLPGVAAQERGQAGPAAADGAPLVGHVVLCGYGRVGAELGEALERRGVPYAVIEINPAVVRELRARGVPAFYGDAAAEALLTAVAVERAETLAIATPDLVTAHAAVRLARRLNPGIHVIARATAGGEVGPLAEAGADEVVQPEFEAGLEFARQVLRWHDVDAGEVTAAIGRRRTAFYGSDDAASRRGSVSGTLLPVVVPTAGGDDAVPAGR
ncbi:MAG: Inner membrane protein, KefB/KefC family [uncultured Thermomicrobiales bacterium]|uniref:Inner membrane protein, KefB/KefC family n=1 Tax=uncultured Thermomicrobiales bacterium TaxID=1645740 RepID=A0A6J4VHT4_9BACT|nr:MAG: Inner membrane protein, KefB/KefC family [uncultured Thermomicrobiales bacterium]